jgi:hypothetical protein
LLYLVYTTRYRTVPLRVARVPECPGIFSSGQQGAGARGVSVLQPHRPLRQPSGTTLELEGRHLQYAIIHRQSQKHAECVQCRLSHGVPKCHSGHSSIHGSVAQDPSLHRRFRAPHGEAEFASQSSIAFLAENAPSMRSPRDSWRVGRLPRPRTLSSEL